LAISSLTTSSAPGLPEAIMRGGRPESARALTSAPRSEAGARRAARLGKVKFKAGWGRQRLAPPALARKVFQREVPNMRSSSSVWAVALVSAASLTCWAGPPRATKIDEKLADKLGREVVQAAHPTAKDVALLDHKEATKDGRQVLSIKMKYYGKVTSAKYTANVTIILDPTREPPRVVDVDYKDDNQIPASKKRLKDVSGRLEKLLPKKF